jgi:hypothetical protein
MSKIRDDDDTHAKHKSTPAPAPTVEPQAIVPGTWPSPIDAYRSAVHGVAVTVVNPLPGDMLLPYPTGTPLPVGSAFWLRNGYYKSAVPT